MRARRLLPLVFWSGVFLIGIGTFAYALPPKLPKFPELKFQPPKALRTKLSNGIVLYLLEDGELPLLQISATIRAGAQYDPPEKIGLGELLARTQRTGGTKKYDAETLNRKLESLGASIETGMDLESAGVSASALSKDSDLLLELFAQVLTEPSFDSKKLEIERAQALEEVRRRNDEPRAIASRELPRELYGKDHPYGWRKESQTLRSIRRKDLLRYHRRFFRPENTLLAVSGDFQASEMMKALEKLLGSWRGKGRSQPAAVLPVQPRAARRVILYEKPVTQSAIRMGHFGLKRHHPDHFSFEVLNDILGGNPFSSRLFANIRSRQGLAYYAASRFTEPSDWGTFFIALGTKNSTAARAIRAVLAELEKIRREPVSASELRLAKESLANSFVFNYSDSHQITTQQMQLEYYGFPEDYLNTYVPKIKAVTRRQVLEAAQKHLSPEELVLLVVTDPKQLDASLEEFGRVEGRQPD
ncbi:MAG: insulinase family protein [Elusimicrobia bacterium]|nr:insulinase family protein [Elusimicrobiota bacterium]